MWGLDENITCETLIRTFSVFSYSLTFNRGFWNCSIHLESLMVKCLAILKEGDLENTSQR